MKSIFIMLVLLAAAIALPVLAENSSKGKPLIERLSESKHTLLDGIAQAEKENGFAISAKFEIGGDGDLALSVYTAKNGRDKDAEHNVLMEIIGDAASSKWEPKTEVFEDKAHIARSAMQLTLMQLTKLSLSDIVKKACVAQKGTAYSAIPAVEGRKQVVNVKVYTAEGKNMTVCMDAQTGEVVEE